MLPLQVLAFNRYSITCQLVLLATLLTQVELLKNPGRLFYDQFIRASGHSPSKDIVIVAIDQYSLTCRAVGNIVALRSKSHCTGYSLC